MTPRRRRRALITHKRGLILTMTLRVVLQHDDRGGAVHVCAMILGLHARLPRGTLGLVSREAFVPLHHW